MKVLWLIAALVLGFAAYVRLAPSDPERWNRPIEVDADRDLEGGAMRRVAGAGPRLDRLDEIARATPRTEVLAGSVDDGRITYVTRSKLWGFPDYTTVQRDGADLALFARLRFGKGDMGVNKARLDDWIARLETA